MELDSHTRSRWLSGSTQQPKLRPARMDEADAIDALMKESIAAIFPHFYDEAQTRASIRYIANVDRTLIEDGTYFAVDADGEVVACGGWSRRGKLYTGSGDAAGDARLLDPATEPARVRAMFVRGDWTRRGLGTRILEACETAAREEGFQTLALVGTLPGVPLYERYGFVTTGEAPVTMPNGTTVAAVAMEKPITQEEDPMPFYLTRFSYTPETWAKLVKNPEDRRAAATEYIESVGGKLHGFWYAFGDHDAYSLWEAPDNVSMAATAIAISAGGALSSFQTTPLLTVEETLAALEKAASIRYRPPGDSGKKKK